MAPQQYHIKSPRLLDGEICQCGSMITCVSEQDKASGEWIKYGKVRCAFKSQCFSLVVLDALTDEEKKILDSNAASRRKMLDCRLKRLGCNSLATASQQCPYIACKPCCQEQKKLCLTHGEHEQLTPDWRARKLSDGLPAEIWCVKNTPVASGGFAQVYHGRWGLQEVAIKTMKNQESEVTTTLRRNQNELGVWREADHPNLVPLLATIDKGGLKSMVTPFYNNGDLTKYLRPNDGLVLRHHLLVGAAEGLRYLHDKNTAHGDLSMVNILVSDDNRALLTDFGLALPPSRTGYTTSENQNGCPVYKAPECFISDASVSPKARTPASDMWAFGIIIVQVLCNRLPYKGQQDASVIFTMVDRGCRPFDAFEINGCLIHIELRDMIHACFNQTPQDRPSISQVLEELKECHRQASR